MTPELDCTSWMASTLKLEKVAPPSSGSVVSSIDGEDGGGATLAVDGELLREIGGAVAVRHGAGGEEKKPAEVSLVEGQAGHFSGGETLAATGLGRSRVGSNEDAEFLPLGGELKSGGERDAVFKD